MQSRLASLLSRASTSFSTRPTISERSASSAVVSCSQRAGKFRGCQASISACRRWRWRGCRSTREVVPSPSRGRTDPRERMLPNRFPSRAAPPRQPARRVPPAAARGRVAMQRSRHTPDDQKSATLRRIPSRPAARPIRSRPARARLSPAENRAPRPARRPPPGPALGQAAFPSAKWSAPARRQSRQARRSRVARGPSNRETQPAGRNSDAALAEPG